LGCSATFRNTRSKFGLGCSAPNFTDVGDPVGIGLVASLARPGGNITGFANISTELMPKLLELLCELVPQAGVIALLVNPNNPNSEGIIR
jgi:putative ABC transport system substrate-binding protein